MIVLSALQKRGTDFLREKIVAILTELKVKSNALIENDTEQSKEMTIAIVGKRNVGKSSLVNALSRQERTIVSEIPGTTRDAIDVRFERDAEIFTAIDTAGVKKKNKLKEAIEMFSQQRTEYSIKRADVAILLIDAQENISEVDKRIAKSILENNKPCIIAINKWDLVKGKVTLEEYKKYLDKTLAQLDFAPLVLISAKTGFNLTRMIKVSKTLHQQAGLKIQTALLNKVIEKIKARLPVAHRGAKQPKIYYASQTGTYPPTITLMINNHLLFSKQTLRYVEEQLRKQLPISEVPIKVIIKSKKAKIKM